MSEPVGYEVAVVGGGIHGATAALELARRGTKAILVERATPGDGPTTGRSTGICRAYYTNELLAEVAHRSLELFANFPEYSGGGWAGFKRTGLLWLHPPENAPLVRERLSALDRIGIRLEIMDAAALASRCPEVALDGVSLAIWEPEAGHADPAATTRAVFDRAVELGLRAQLHVAVVDIVVDGPGPVRLALSSGETVKAERVLIAAGPWTRRLARMVHVDLPLHVERHVVVTLGCRGADLLPFGCADLGRGFYSKPERPELRCLGWLRSGTPASLERLPDPPSTAEAESLVGTAVRRVPALAELEVRGGWAGLYDVSPDWQPVIGEIAPNIVVDAGTSGHGFKLALALAPLVVDVVCGTRPDARLGQFSPDRFAGRKLLAAGHGDARIVG